MISRSVRFSVAAVHVQQLRRKCSARLQVFPFIRVGVHNLGSVAHLNYLNAVAHFLRAVAGSERAGSSFSFAGKRDFSGVVNDGKACSGAP